MSVLSWEGLAALAGRRVHVLGLAGTEGAAMARFLWDEGVRDLCVHDLAEGEALEKAFLRNHVGIPRGARRARWEALRDLPIERRLGARYLEGLEDAEAIFLPQAWYLYERNLGPVEEARGRGVPLYGLMDLYFGLSAAPIVAVTGSNGKSTTSRALEHMLRIAAEGGGATARSDAGTDEAGGARPELVGDVERDVGGASATGPAPPLPLGRPARVFYAGNERRSVQVLDELRGMRPADRLVLEVSNRHLREAAYAPRIGAITNVLPNHLDEHGDDPAAYAAAKRRLLDTQRPVDAAILNADDPVSVGLAAGLPGRVLRFSRRAEPEAGAWLQDGRVCLRLTPSGAVEDAGPIDAARLPGAHNQENLLAAALAARLAGAAPAEIAEGVARFGGLRHRIQLVWGAEGVTYYDDLNSTTPQATLAALAALEGPLLLIAGGDDKGLALEELAEAINERVRILVLLPGPGGDRIEAAVRSSAAEREAEDEAKSGVELVRIARFEDFAEAVAFVVGEAREGESVLLSPACPYFFRRNYLSGGREVGFKALLRELAVGAS